MVRNKYQWLNFTAGEQSELQPLAAGSKVVKNKQVVIKFNHVASRKEGGGESAVTTVQFLYIFNYAWSKIYGRCTALQCSFLAMAKEEYKCAAANDSSQVQFILQRCAVVPCCRELTSSSSPYAVKSFHSTYGMKNGPSGKSKFV